MITRFVFINLCKLSVSRPVSLGVFCFVLHELNFHFPRKLFILHLSQQMWEKAGFKLWKISKGDISRIPANMNTANYVIFI